MNYLPIILGFLLGFSCSVFGSWLAEASGHKWYWGNLLGLMFAIGLVLCVSVLSE